MKILGNAAVLVAALSVMGGIMLAQRDYQNSWREPSAVQTSATVVPNASMLERVGEYNIVMK
jgi:hypothetical protein